MRVDSRDPRLGERHRGLGAPAAGARDLGRAAAAGAPAHRCRDERLASRQWAAGIAERQGVGDRSLHAGNPGRLARRSRRRGRGSGRAGA